MKTAKRDYACPKCRRHYRLDFGPDYFCNCKQKEKRRGCWNDPQLELFVTGLKGVRAEANPIGTGEAFYTCLNLLPELNSVFGIERT